MTAARPFRLRLRGDKVRLVEYLPEHGSLLVMRGRTNADWEHMVPKTAKQVGERINLTFRFKPTTRNIAGRPMRSA